MANNNPTYKWQPGQSGNPSGVSKDSADLRGRLKALTPKAIKILEAILDADNINLKDKMATARFIIERCVPAETEASSAETPTESNIDRLANILIRPRKQTNDEVAA